jgi:hypothetical protein
MQRSQSICGAIRRNVNAGYMNCKGSYVWPELVAPSRGVRPRQASEATEKTFNKTQLIVKCPGIKAELSYSRPNSFGKRIDPKSTFVALLG